VGWFQRRRERRQAEIQKAVALAIAASKPPDDALNALNILTEIGKLRLESEKIALNAEIERIKATAADRQEERDYERKHKLEVREAKVEAARKARELRAAGGGFAGRLRKLGVTEIPPFAQSCEDCRAAIEGRKPAHNNDMFEHASQRHGQIISRILEAQRAATPAQNPN